MVSGKNVCVGGRYGRSSKDNRTCMDDGVPVHGGHGACGRVGAEKMSRDELCLIVMLIAIDLYIKFVVKDIFRR